MELLNSLLFSQVEIVLARKPSRQSLYDLLKISSPHLSKDEVLIEAKRKKAYRLLLSRIHPDKHPTRNDSTEVFQDVQVFFDESLLFLPSKVDSMVPKKKHEPRDKPRTSEYMKENEKQKANVQRSDLYSNRSHGKLPKHKKSPLNKREPFQPKSSKSLQSPNRTKASGSPFPGSRDPKRDYNEGKETRNEFSESRMDENSMRSDESERMTRNFSSSSDNVDYPKQFHVQEKWPYLTFDEDETTPGGTSFLKNHLIPNVASQCVNARGAIAHGRKPTKLYKWWDDATVLNSRSVEEFFDHHGGLFYLDSAGDMKDELMTRGPIISTSFRPSDEFFERMKNLDSLSSSLKGKRHPVLILGWKETTTGDSCWLVCPLSDYQQSGVLVVPFGQMNIDDKCVAPKDNFQNNAWQEGNCFDLDLTEVVGWRYMEKLEIMVDSSYLEELGSCFGCNGFVSALKDDSTFLLRNAEKIAHSRECRLENIAWDDMSNQWILNLHFVNE